MKIIYFVNLLWYKIVNTFLVEVSSPGKKNKKNLVEEATKDDV